MLSFCKHLVRIPLEFRLKHRKLDLDLIQTIGRDGDRRGHERTGQDRRLVAGAGQVAQQQVDEAQSGPFPGQVDRRPAIERVARTDRDQVMVATTSASVTDQRKRKRPPRSGTASAIPDRHQDEQHPDQTFSGPFPAGWARWGRMPAR